MMEKMYKAGIVSYTNVLPFLYGLEKWSEVDLYDEYPSLLAKNFFEGKYDLALLPIGALLKHKDDYEIVSNYCIGVEKKVDSVCLYSFVPLEEINTVILDYQSATSVRLIRVLDKFFLHKNFNYENASTNDYIQDINGKKAAIVIGDRTFGLNGQFLHVYDLAAMWNDFTGLPFVFAVWVARKGVLPSAFKKEFDVKLSSGVNNIPAVVEQYKTKTALSEHELRKYFTSINKDEDYELTLKNLAESKQVIFDFFDNVKVNDEDKTIQKNRLELIQMFCKTFDNYINF